MLAQERQPKREKLIRAGEHDAHNPARAMLGVVADRKRDRALEGLAHSGQALAMGKPVGHDSECGAGDNVEQPEHCPHPNYRESFLTLRECIDDPPEQHGFGQLDEGNGDAGRDQRERKHAFGCEHAKRAKIDPGHRHELPPWGSIVSSILY